MIVPEIGRSAKVCFQSWSGQFVCAENGGGNTVVANRTSAKEWETFEMYRIDDTHVSIKAYNNNSFLCAVNGGGANVVANTRADAKEWETFSICIDQNGLISLGTYDGQHYLSAETDGTLSAKENSTSSWKTAFRIVAPENANIDVLTKVEVNVYKIGGVAPFWHTGTVIDGREYYFNTNNHVDDCSPKGMNFPHHRTMVRMIPGNLDRAKLILNNVKNNWNGTRYDVTRHNCNFFTNELLLSLGAPGLDREYLNNSGLAKIFREIPGSATAQELLLKWPIEDKRILDSLTSDVDKALSPLLDAVKSVGDGIAHAGEEVKKIFKKLKI